QGGQGLLRRIPSATNRAPLLVQLQRATRDPGQEFEPSWSPLYSGTSSRQVRLRHTLRRKATVSRAAKLRAASTWVTTIGSMPSYRAILPIGDVYPGHRPEEVMDSAVAAVSSIATVEHTDIQILSGVPQIVVRFHIDDDDDAQT